jgi:hypothetical protein
LELTEQSGNGCEQSESESDTVVESQPDSDTGKNQADHNGLQNTDNRDLYRVSDVNSMLVAKEGTTRYFDK